VSSPFFQSDPLIPSPQSFHGPIQVTAPVRPPVFLSTLSAQLLPVAHPYASFYNTFVVPASLVCDSTPTIPEGETGPTGPTYSKSDQSKLLIASQKGRVVIGYRETHDEGVTKGMDLKVGVQGGGKKKRWWKG
jgi:hypothetical protein